MEELRPPDQPMVTAADLKARFASRQAHYLPPMISEELESRHADPDHRRMSDMTRDEIKSRLEASEARVATAVEGMRADAANLRADVKAALSEIRSQGDRAQASADKFYADAGRMLAEIRLAGEQNKTTVMGMGYKVITWTLGTILAIGGVSVGVYNALKPRQDTWTASRPIEIVPADTILRRVPAPVTDKPTASPSEPSRSTPPPEKP